LSCHKSILHKKPLPNGSSYLILTTYSLQIKLLDNHKDIVNNPKDLMNLEIKEKHSPQESPEKRTKTKTANILILETFLGNFLDLAKEGGLTLLEVEFNIEKTRNLADGTIKRIITPVGTSTIERIDNRHWVDRTYLLDGKDATYFLQFINYSTQDGESHFIGISKMTPLSKAKNKREWKDELIDRKIEPQLWHNDEAKLLPSVSIDFDGGIMAYVRKNGEDHLLDTFYNNLTDIAQLSNMLFSFKPTT